MNGRSAFVSACAAIAVALGGAARWLGVRQFGAADYGSFANHLWALHLGAAPYSELQTPYPPLFLAGAKLAALLFGVRFVGLVNVAAIFTAFAFAGLVFCLRLAGVSRAWSLAVALVIACATMLPTSVWSYNGPTGIVAAAFLAAAWALAERPSHRGSQGTFAVVAALLALCKPNVAGLLLVGAAALLLLTPARLTAPALLALAAVIALGALLAIGGNPMSLAEIYVQAGGARAATPAASSRVMWWGATRQEVPNTLAALVPIGFAAATLLPSWREPAVRRLLAVAVLGALTTVLTWVTNRELKLVDCAPLVVTSALAVLHANTPGARSRRALLATGLVLLGGWAAIVSVRRDRVRSVGPDLFHQDAALRAIEDPPFLRGVLASPRMHEAIADVAHVLEERGYVGRLDAPVLFGPRLEWCYAAFGIAPPKGAPMMMDLYPTGAPETQGAIAFLRDADSIELAILYNGEFEAAYTTSWPGELVEVLEARFTGGRSGSLTVYERRAP